MLQLKIESSSELDKIISIYTKEDKNVVALFTGNKTENGKSWCPDCVVAEPVIQGVLDGLMSDDKLVFLTVFVGDLPTWKCTANQYRNHPKFAINCVPTLINITKNQRLEEGGCAESALVSKLFSGSLDTDKTVKAGTCEGGVCRIR